MPDRTPQLVLVTLALGVLAACTAVPGTPSEASGSDLAQGPPTASLPASARASRATASSPASADPSAPGSPMPPPAGEAEAVMAAVAALLELDGAAVTMGVDRWKGEEGPEHLIVGAGIVEPAAGRGRMRYDLSALVTIPGGSPSPLDRIDVTWDDETLWARPADGDGWEANPREAARETGGLIGRLPDEVVGLAEVVAGSGPGSVTTLPSDGTAARYLVAVPIDAAADLGVPADAPHADVVREAYGIDEIPVEVWLRDGEVVRLRYTFEREKALYGGPDRTRVTYDWTADPTVRVELPPSD